jgi:hypothetical protein
MTRWLSLLFVVSCSCDGRAARLRVSEEEFGREYAAKFCAEWERCNEGDTAPDCPLVAAGGTTTGVVEDCDFDAEAAQTCLDIDWICSFDGFPNVSPPQVCSEVCGAT